MMLSGVEHETNGITSRSCLLKNYSYLRGDRLVSNNSVFGLDCTKKQCRPRCHFHQHLIWFYTASQFTKFWQLLQGRVQNKDVSVFNKYI